MDKKTIFWIILAFVISSFTLFIGYAKAVEPSLAYHVYLAGESLGVIGSGEDLNTYIDNKQTEIKKKYGVDIVYAPNDLDIVEEWTYCQDRNSISEIYSLIAKKAPFTIEGYEVNIGSVTETTEEGDVLTDPVVVYVLDKNVFSEAVKNTVFAFVDEDSYNKFINHEQKDIETVGTLIEDIYIENEITIKKAKISIEQKIYTDSENLSKYLLFGTTEKQSTYTVKAGDTIEKVSFNNKLSPEEFLIANPEFSSVNNLLYAGQKVTLGIIKPAFKVIEETHVVEIVTRPYDRTVVYDSTLNEGVEYTKQKGIDGSDKVTKKVYTKNGEIYGLVTVSQESIKPSVEEIIVVGTKYVPEVGNPKIWSWPTKKPYSITSPYGYRWGKLHSGMDIVYAGGTSRGTPIYAANNGVVVLAEYNSYNGNWVSINHNNGYYSLYGHMASLTVKTGQIVASGQQIGTMGDTGYAFGVHLHFSVLHNGQSINPYILYR